EFKLPEEAVFTSQYRSPSQGETTSTRKFQFFVPRISIEEIPEMSTEEIRIKLKKSIAKIANINLDEIPDNASYKDDLQLDSLTILEIAVDAEYQFQVKLSDDDLGVLRTVDDTVKMVQHYLSPVMA